MDSDCAALLADAFLLSLWCRFAWLTRLAYVRHHGYRLCYGNAHLDKTRNFINGKMSFMLAAMEAYPDDYLVMLDLGEI